MRFTKAITAAILLMAMTMLVLPAVALDIPDGRNIPDVPQDLKDFVFSGDRNDTCDQPSVDLVTKLDLIEDAKRDKVRSSWGVIFEDGTLGDIYFAAYNSSTEEKKVLLVNLTSEKWDVVNDYGAFEALREHYYG